MKMPIALGRRSASGDQVRMSSIPPTVFVLFVGMWTSSVTIGAASPAERIVKSFGPKTTVDDVRQLRQWPREAVRLLVQNLHTIPESKIVSLN
jgi:hypothetical protein